MRIISLDFNKVTRMYFMADGGDIYTRQINAGGNLENIVNNVDLIVKSKKKIKIRIYPDFSEEDISRIKKLFDSRGYKKMIYEKYIPPKR